MDGSNELGIPKFLTKTFEMVEDPETDPIVSWNIHRNSFIVWDSHEFSANLLPKYFKHNNFSSFIRQLNSYGFRKIDCDSWEFANEGFQGGKKHLLKSIKNKRKSKHNSTNNLRLKAEIGILKKNQSELQMEVMKLRQKNAESNDKLSVYEDQIRFAECRQQQMFNFIAKLVKFPSLFQELVQNKQQQKEEPDEHELSAKKRKLLETQVTKSLHDPMETDQSVAKSGAKPIKIIQSITKILPELLGTDESVTKSLFEPKKTDHSITKSLHDPMETDQSAAKSGSKPIGIVQSITKILSELLGTDESVAKSLSKLTKTNKSVTKSLPESKETDHSITKSLPESKETDHSITKNLHESKETDHSITKNLSEPKETDQSIIHCISQIYHERLDSMLSDNFKRLWHSCVEKELGTYRVGQKNISAPEMSSAMAEILLGESSCEENAINEEELSVNDSEIYLELKYLINSKSSSLSGFASDQLVAKTDSV